MKNLELYMFAACPFCQRVVSFAAMNNISLELKDVREDEKFKAELLKKGGKKQVPFLVDVSKWIQMYESDDILEYLGKNYI